MSATPTPTPGELANASSGMMDGFASTNGLTGVIGAVATAVVILLAISYASSSLERYERIKALAGFVARLFKLAAFGLGGVVVLGAVTAPAYYVASQPTATRTEWLSYAGYALAAFLGLAAFGWVVERIVAGLRARHAEATGQPAPEPIADGGDDG